MTLGVTVDTDTETWRHLPMLRAIAILPLLVGCSAATRTTFHPTDAAYRPSPGPTPMVYVMERDLVDLPAGPMRSVGLIEVTVPASRCVPPDR